MWLSKRKRRYWVVLAAFISMILVAIAQSPAHAQPLPPHDLSLTYRHGLHGVENGEWIFTLTNEGQQHAHSGQVKVSFRRYVGGDFEFFINSASIKIDPQLGNFEPATGIWQFRNLAPGQTTELKFHAGFTRPPGGTTEGILIIGRGEIVSSTPRERPEYLHNNATREAWKYDTQRIGHAAEGNAIVEIQGSEERFPEANETVDFTVRFRNAAGYAAIDDYHDMYDVLVKLTPSPGLELVSAAAPSGMFGATGYEIQISSSFNRSTGIWNLGSVPENEVILLYIDMPVTVRYTGAVSLQEACLTAEVVNVVPPERPDNPDIQRDSKFRVCLGEDPTMLFQEGEIDLTEFYPCVGVTAYPCNDQDTLELVTSISVPRDSERNIVRDVGIDRYDHFADSKFVTFFQPESIVLQVGDLTPRGREMDDNGKPFWSTDSEFVLYDSQTLLPDSTWSSARMDLAVTGPNGGPASGSFTLAYPADYEIDPIEITDTTKVIGEPFDTGYDADFWLEFRNLGTYILTLDIRATHSTAGELTDSGTYTFHVGPAAELEVRDAGANPELPSGKWAYTVMAVNNGPDIPPAAQVTLTGVPEGAEAVASQGSYDPGDCQNGLCPGVWDIGELRLSDFHRASGLPGDGPTLTLITDAPAGSTITAEIENMQDYCVRIKSGGGFSDDLECQGTLPSGYTEHMAKYYDHRPGNNRATVEARPGTGRLQPDAPRSLRVNKYGSLALLRWLPPASGAVNRFGITRYQVERNGIILPDEAPITMYVDLGGGSVNQAYRVRAVNDQGVPGPWSLPVGTGGPVEQPDELDAPTGLTATAGVGEGRIDLSWFAPSDETGLRYRIEHATDGAGPWRTLAGSHSGTTYSHGGLLSGTTHYYRVRAEKGNVVSPWAYVQETTEIVGGVAVYAPGWPENLRFTSLARTSVTLAWDPPVDDGGSPVTGYEYRVYGPCEDGSSAVCDIVAPTRVRGTSVSISLPNRMGDYQFDVRALNAVGAGDWAHGPTKEVGPQDAGGGRVILSPTSLTLAEGSEATYRVKLSSNPALPVAVWLHWIGDEWGEDLGNWLPFQQGQVLLPSGYDTSGLPDDCYGYRWKEMAYDWNVGVPIMVVAEEDDDSENGRLTIIHDIATLAPECLNFNVNNPDDLKEYESLYLGLYGIALEVTERDND